MTGTVLGRQAKLSNIDGSSPARSAVRARAPSGIVETRDPFSIKED
jgi:hypothetical protein